VKGRSVVALVLVALAAGAIAARADSGSSSATTRVRPKPVPPTVVLAAPRPPVASKFPFVAKACVAPGPFRIRPQAPGSAPKPPPPRPLLAASPTLSPPRTPADALPTEAVSALRLRGLEPVSADSARLLRSTPAGGKAWVVPVPDVSRANLVACERDPNAKP